MASPHTKLLSALLPNAVSRLTAPVGSRWPLPGFCWNFSVGFSQDTLCNSKINTDEGDRSII